MTPLLFALALQAAPIVAPGAAPAKAAPAPAEAAKVAAADPYERICRRDIRTGSRITTPTCHTREEWDRVERGAQAFMERALHPTGCAPGSTC